MVRTQLFIFLTLAFFLNASAQEQPYISDLDDQKALDEIFSTALTESSVYPWLGKMCDSIGHRLSGSPEAAQAVDYSAKIMAELGIKVVKQPVMVPHWVRGEPESGYVQIGEKSIRVRLLALGGSVPTPEGGLSAEIIEVSDWEQLEALGKKAVEGKIVFFNEPMNPTNIYTFHSYGHCVRHRWGGAVEAAKYGAVGAIVRSLSLRLDTFAHTGSMTYENALDSIPAAAVSTVDAALISEAISNGEVVELNWKQSCKSLPDIQSHNVVGEIRGTENPDEIILLGGHLDSWDVGDGAHDDGAGVMQSLAVLELFKKLGYKPKHTIRVVFFMNEENGLRGAKKYAELSELEGLTHVVCIESDRGGFTPRGFYAEGNDDLVQRIIDLKPLLEKYGVHQLQEGGSGADIKPLQTDDNVLIGFVPDSQRYFDHHHSANDTFDTVNKRELELGAASIAALVYMLDKYGI
ncbi:MAG: M28 family peptidase [Salibacteraceae bacterium]